MRYKCNKCGFTTNRKSTYDAHCNRKTSCSAKIKYTKSNVCDYCNKTLSNPKSVYRHLKSGACKEYNGGDMTVINKTYNDNRKTINNNLSLDGDVRVVKFGDENLSYISDDIFKQILGRGFKAVEEFIEHSHFNSDHPENHNIYIANIKDDYVIMYDGNKWIIDKKDDIMEDIIYAKSDFLNLKFQELMGEMNQHDIDKFAKFINERDEDKTMNKLKSDIKLQLYNNRYLPQKLRKQLEANNKKLSKDTKRISNSNSAIDEINNLLQNTTDDNIESIRKLLLTLNERPSASG